MSSQTNTGRVLLAEDDQDLAGITRDYLEAKGHRVVLCPNAQSVYEILKNQVFDLLILDINLPDEDGFSICREIITQSDLPIIFASARTSEKDKIQALDLGGDDYLAKPYSLQELDSRVKALLRRVYKQEGKMQIYQAGPLWLDPHARRARLNGQDLILSPREFDLLAFFLQNPEVTLTKEEILAKVWGTYAEAELATVAVHVRWLREKIEPDPSHPIYIKTVWGAGYRFENA